MNIDCRFIRIEIKMGMKMQKRPPNAKSGKNNENLIVLQAKYGFTRDITKQINNNEMSNIGRQTIFFCMLKLTANDAGIRVLKCFCLHFNSKLLFHFVVTGVSCLCQVISSLEHVHAWFLYLVN